MVVNGGDGMDEMTLGAETRVAEINGEQPIREYEISPEDFGLRRAPRDGLVVNDRRHAAAVLRGVLAGEQGAAHDVLAMNAGAAIYIGGGAKSIGEGVEQARAILASGRALTTIEKLISASHEQD